MRSEKKVTAVLAALALNLMVSIFILCYLFVPFKADDGGIVFDSAGNVEYVLYIGTTDKDARVQIIPTEQAIEIVSGICVKYGEGYTASVAQGGWIDGDGSLWQETSLIFSLIGADENNVAAIMDEVIKELNQNSVLLEKRDISSVLYEGIN